MTVEEAADLEHARALLGESDAARRDSDYATARAKASAAIDALLQRPEADRDAAWLDVLYRGGHAARNAQDTHAAHRAWLVVLEARSRALPDEHPDLQRARQNLALTMRRLGDLHGAKALQEKVFEVHSRTLPDEHPDLQSARGNLAVTILALGDLHGAKALLEKVLEVRSRTLHDDHPDLQAARQNLALTIRRLGDLHGAKALQEKVLEVRSRTLPDDHPELQAVRGNLAVTNLALGDLHGAKALLQKVLDVRSRTLPDDHPDLQMARQNLAGAILALGDLHGAKVLQEKVLEVCLRTLPGEHPDLQMARQNLALTVRRLGDLHGAKALLAKVLEAHSHSLPDEHPDLQAARQNLASTIGQLGDLHGAKALDEKVLEVRSRTLPDDHPDLQSARQNLAATIWELGDFHGANALFQKVLELRSRTLPDDHPDLQSARQNLALTFRELGDLHGAKALEEKVLEVRSRTLPDDHPDLQAARGNLAITSVKLGDLDGARVLQEKVLEVRTRTLPDEHPDVQKARGNLASAIVAEHALTAVRDGGRAREREGGRERCVVLLAARTSSLLRAARQSLLEAAPREAEARCSSLAEGLSYSLSLAGGLGAFSASKELDLPCFALSETTRGAALSSASVMRTAAGSEEFEKLVIELAARSKALADLAAQGTTSEAFRVARERREETERQLVSLASQLGTTRVATLEFDAGALAAKLEERDAVVAYRRYARTRVAVADAEGRPRPRAPVETSETSLCAFVLRRAATEPGRDAVASNAKLTFVELGPIVPIETAVREWREAIGAGLERGQGVRPVRESMVTQRGNALRMLVLDPLLDAIGDAERVVVVLDDVLQLVPIDALPMPTEGASTPQLAGERWRIDTRRTCTELLASPPERGDGPLVALGGASFNSEPVALSAEDAAAVEDDDLAPGAGPSILRGGAWEPGFTPLTYTGLEARELAALHDEVVGENARSVVLEKRKASRAALEELAPRARWLHVATHGWFASESIRSWADPEPLDKHSGLGLRESGEQQVKGMSPMLLCGLALAGANLPENAVGRAPGLVTADELSALDLTRCELVVLSACDTNVGVRERRAGQGVASLQMALQMAGARSVITSLWKVPDEATKALMLDFYRRLWVEKKPKWQALNEAKRKLRNAKDEHGDPKYTLRDWAAWVLTGEPD